MKIRITKESLETKKNWLIPLCLGDTITRLCSNDIDLKVGRVLDLLDIQNRSARCSRTTLIIKFIQTSYTIVMFIYYLTLHRKIKDILNC